MRYCRRTVCDETRGFFAEFAAVSSAVRAQFADRTRQPDCSANVQVFGGVGVVRKGDCSRM